MVQLRLVSNLQDVFSNKEALESDLNSAAEDLAKNINRLREMNKDNREVKVRLENYKQRLEHEILELEKEK